MKLKPYSTTRSIITVLATALVVAHSAQAAVEAWAGSAGSVDWTTAANWTGTHTPPISGDSLTFGANASSSNTLTDTLTTGAFNLTGITYNSGAPAYVMTGNAFKLTGSITNNSAVTQSINNDIVTGDFRTAAGAVILNGNVSGASSVRSYGSSTLTLAGLNNSYSNGTELQNTSTFIISGKITGGSTIYTNSATLQLQANAGNTVSGTAAIVNSGIQFQAGATLQLRSDDNVTITTGAFANFGGVTINVDQVTGSGSNKAITLTPAGGIAVGTSTMNVTGAHGYTLALGTIATSGTWTINTTTANATIGSISGSAIVKSGTGAVTLTGSSSYTGTTTVSGGTLVINGSISTGAVAVTNVDSTLGGTGTIGGATTLSAGTNLSAGDASAGTLTFGGSLNVSAAANDTEAFIFTLGTAADRILLTGNTANVLSIGTNLLSASDFAFTAGSGFASGQTYNLFDLTGAGATINGTFSPFSTSFGGYTADVKIVGNDIVMTNIVPEPTTWGLVTFSLITIMGRRSRP